MIVKINKVIERMKGLNSTLQFSPKISKRNGHIVALDGSTFQGSGMNYFLLNNALRWKKFGYRVTIICQDRKAVTMPIVDSYFQGQFPPDAPKLNGGELRVVVPDVNNIIPISTSSQYCEFPGIKSKPVHQMTEQQIETNISMTIKCLQAVIEHDKPYKVIANYLIMSGTICQKGLSGYKIPFDIITPGPSLQYSVKPYKHLLKWILPGFKKAQVLFQLTHFVKSQFLKCFSTEIERYKLANKIKVINPGINSFNYIIPKSMEQCEKQFKNKIKQFKEKIQQNYLQDIPIHNHMNSDQIHQILIKYYKKYQQINLQNNLLQKWIPYSQNDQIIIYAGAIINNKGMGDLLAIAPKLIEQRPTLKFIFCGSGPYRWHMSQLIKAFQNGDSQRAKLIANAGDFITQVDIESYFIKTDKAVSERILFCCLTSTHEILSNLLPLCTLYICPNRILESCNLNIVQAMLYGVTPICNDHSWHTQVLNEIQDLYPELTAVSRVSRSQFYKKLPQTIINTLDFIKYNQLTKVQYKHKIRKIAVDKFSWEQSALKLAQPRQYHEYNQVDDNHN